MTPGTTPTGARRTPRSRGPSDQIRGRASEIINNHGNQARNDARRRIDEALRGVEYDLQQAATVPQAAQPQPPTATDQQQVVAANNQQQPINHELAAVQNFAEGARGQNGRNALRSRHILNAMMDDARSAIQVIGIERVAGRSVLSTPVITTLLSIQNKLFKGKIADAIGYVGAPLAGASAAAFHTLGGIDMINTDPLTLAHIFSGLLVSVGGFWWKASIRENIAREIDGLHQTLNRNVDQCQHTPSLQGISASAPAAPETAPAAPEAATTTPPAP